jgi:uncharacterized membrane protein YfcA
MHMALFPDLPPLVITFLIASAGVTSFLSASLGAGGGVMLLGIMAQFIPPQLIIPLHGIVQLGSNLGRSVMSWSYIRWFFIYTFLPGAIVGSLLGYFLLLSLPPAVIYLTIAGFILYLCWGPALPAPALGRIGIVLTGLITTFLSLFVGATGPLVGALIKQMDQDRFQTVATFATAMTVQHLCKIVVFEQAGFSLEDWGFLLGSMIISGFCGTWIGLRLLKHLPEVRFRQLFNGILSLLALRLIWQAYMTLN